jgi:hypothetical protein
MHAYSLHIAPHAHELIDPYLAIHIAFVAFKAVAGTHICLHSGIYNPRAFKAVIIEAPILSLGGANIVRALFITYCNAETSTSTQGCLGRRLYTCFQSQ